MPFVKTAKLQALSFGLPRREHVILIYDDPSGRWWLHQPIAEVNKLVIDGEELTARVVNSQIYAGDEQLNYPRRQRQGSFRSFCESDRNPLRYRSCVSDSL
jgi:hypothetical protein